MLQVRWLYGLDLSCLLGVFSNGYTVPLIFHVQLSSEKEIKKGNSYDSDAFKVRSRLNFIAMPKYMIICHFVALVACTCRL